jgi:mercuric ion binding protein
LVQANKSTMESGLIQWKINLLQGEIKVQFWPDRADAAAIKAALNNAGFDADDDKAEPEAYAKLCLPICKRAEDGGGPKPPKPCHIKPYSIGLFKQINLLSSFIGEG